MPLTHTHTPTMTLSNSAYHMPLLACRTLPPAQGQPLPCGCRALAVVHMHRERLAGAERSRRDVALRSPAARKNCARERALS